MVMIRPLEHGDLSAALTLQAEAYPAFLREDRDAFASRIDTSASYCLAATRNGLLIGYLLAHAWARGTPPAIGLRLPKATPHDVLFVHDLAIAPAGRGLGIGLALTETAFAAAARDGLRYAELIAVEGAAHYWRTLGFAEAPFTPSIATKLAAYGAEARWMTRFLSAGPDTP